MTTLDPSYKGSDTTLSNGNLTAAFSSNYHESSTYSTDSHASGKWYFEVIPVDSDTTGFVAVAVSTLRTLSVYLGNEAGGNAAAFHEGATSFLGRASQKMRASSSAAYASNGGDGNPIGYAVDIDAGKVWIRINGTWVGDPVAGTDPMYTSVTGTLYAAVGGANSTVTINFGATAFEDAAPSGYTAWGGASAVEADIAATEAQDTSTINGTVRGNVTGSIPFVEAQDTSTINASAGNFVAGSLPFVEAADTFSMTGTYLSGTAGDFALTEASDTVRVIGGSLAIGEKVFVAVGSGGVIAKGTIDGATWTSVSSPTSTTLNGVAYGNSLFVIVGNSGIIYTSPDLSTWTSRTSGIATNINKVAFADGKFVAVGNSGRVLTSSDGVTWSAGTVAGGTLWNVKYGGQWIIAASSNKVFTSSDASSWTQRNTSMTSNYNIRGIAWDGSTYAITGHWSGNVPRINTSTDGVTWTNKTFPSALQGTAYTVVHNGSVFILPWADGSGSTLKRISSTGVSWTSVANLPTGATAINDMVFAEGLSVMVGGSGYIATSTGTTFTKQTSPTGSALNGICQGQLPSTDVYIYGTYAATESQDTAAITGTRIAVYSGDIAVTEDQDVFEISGTSSAVIPGSLVFAEAPDEIILSLARDFADITIDIPLSEVQDTLLINGQKVTVVTRVVRIGAVESPDVSAIRVSSSVRGDIVAAETPDTFRLATGNPGIVMAIQILQSSFDLIVTYGASLFDGGTLDIYSGNQVADPTVDPTGTLLGSIDLPSPAFIEAEDGTATKDGDWEGAATASGVAGWFRLTSADGNHVVDGSVSSGAGDGNLLMSATSLTIGDPLVVESAEFSFELQDEV